MNKSFKVVVADCDHASIAIEQAVLADLCPDVEWKKCRTADDVIAQCAAAEGILLQYAPMPRRVLEKLPRCKVVARYGVGVDTIDLEVAAECGITVCNVPDYGTEEVSDHALALMLCLTRQVCRANAQVKRGEWDYRRIVPVFRHQIQTIGLVGLGLIGRAVARKTHAMGMKVVACDPYVEKSRVPDYVELASLDALLARADVVSVHCPLNAATRNLFDEARLSLMKPMAYLINTARGHIVNEAALEKMLREKRLAGAAMDVLAVEPGQATHPLYGYENFLCTPHMAWYSEESAQELKRKAAEEVAHVLRGEVPRYRVNG